MSSRPFEGLPVTDRIWHVVANANAAAFAYERLVVCRRAAAVQMQRLWDAAAGTRKSLTEPAADASLAEVRAYIQKSREAFAPLLYETHYYFVAWANCGNMLRVLTGLPEFLEAKKIFDSHRKTFEHYTAARNSFEHYQDRLPGNAEERKVREVVQIPSAGPSRIYFGFSGGHYRHSDQQWDITPASLSVLEGAIDAVLSVLHAQVDTLFQARYGYL